jgi:hypothetical protein
MCSLAMTSPPGIIDHSRYTHVCLLSIVITVVPRRHSPAGSESIETSLPLIPSGMAETMKSLESTAGGADSAEILFAQPVLSGCSALKYFPVQGFGEIPGTNPLAETTMLHALGGRKCIFSCDFLQVMHNCDQWLEKASGACLGQIHK